MTATTPRYIAPPTPAELAARLSLPLEHIVKLDANESPWGPSPSALAALRAFADEAGAALGAASRYPDAAATALRTALASYTGVAAEGIVVGNGSDEIIQLLVEALIEPGDEVIVSEPTFSVYSVVARRRGARVVDVARDEQWRTSTDALVAAMTPRTRLVFLCAPNNPTGTPLERATLDAALARAEELAGQGNGAGPLIVVDEAYYELAAFADDPRGWTAAPMLATAGERLIVLRTFSKLFGLAGLRVGYGLASPALAERLRALKPPYNVNLVGQLAALATLDDLDWLRARALDLASERTRLTRLLTTELGLLVWPSAANFVLVDVAAGLTETQARERRRDALWQSLLDQGVMTRRLSGERLTGLLRFTVGLHEQHEMLVTALMRARSDLEGTER